MQLNSANAQRISVNETDSIQVEGKEEEELESEVSALSFPWMQWGRGEYYVSIINGRQLVY